MEATIKAGQEQLRAEIKPGLDEIKTTGSEANQGMIKARAGHYNPCLPPRRTGLSMPYMGSLKERRMRGISGQLRWDLGTRVPRSTENKDPRWWCSPTGLRHRHRKSDLPCPSYTTLGSTSQGGRQDIWAVLLGLESTGAPLLPSTLCHKSLLCFISGGVCCFLPPRQLTIPDQSHTCSFLTSRDTCYDMSSPSTPKYSVASGCVLGFVFKIMFPCNVTWFC
jgi:hypothetical protein